MSKIIGAFVTHSFKPEFGSWPGSGDNLPALHKRLKTVGSLTSINNHCWQNGSSSLTPISGKAQTFMHRSPQVWNTRVTFYSWVKIRTLGLTVQEWVCILSCRPSKNIQPEKQCFPLQVISCYLQFKASERLLYFLLNTPVFACLPKKNHAFYVSQYYPD